MTTWKEIVKSFPSTPFLFVGSGLTRRYLNLPNWDGLLEHFARQLSNDEFAYEKYLYKAKNNKALAATLIEEDFNTAWLEDSSIRSNEESVLNAVRNGATPFRAELTNYISQKTDTDPKYEKEIETLKSLTSQHISGFITTNYDKFLETIAPDYKVYIGQDQLIFSSIQEVAEIFKIHGSVDDPNSIVINKADYEAFDDKQKYLAAKLLTIFMEYPIIFIGYSLSDDNIQKILENILTCLSQENANKLKGRFIFVNHDKNLPNSIDVGLYTQKIGNSFIEFTKISTDNYQLVFEELKNKKAGLPVRLLRMLKEELYNYTVTTNVSKHVYVNPYDPNVPDEEICFSIGQDSQMAKQGLNGITSEQLYKDIILGGIIGFSADDILEALRNGLAKANTKLPIYKYLSKAELPHNEIREKYCVDDFDGLLGKTAISSRKSKNYTSVQNVISIFKTSNGYDPRIWENLAYLTEEQIDLKQLEDFLIDYFTSNPDVLSVNSTFVYKSNIRRIIRIYDWLKYRQ